MIPVDQFNSCQSALPALHPRTSISAFQLGKKADASKRTERRECALRSAVHQSRCVSRRHQAGESPIAGYERGDGWARIAAGPHAADASLAAGLPAAAGPRGGHPARQAPHRGLVRTGSAGPPAASRGMLGAARMPEGRGHRRSPRPFLWPLARHARQGRCLHPGLAAASRGGRLRSGGLEVVTIGPLRSPIRVLEDLRERDPAPGPSQDHTISIPPPGVRCPAPAAAAKQWSTVVIAGRE